MESPSAEGRLAELAAANAASRKRLEELVNGLSVSQLALQMEDSEWTISAALAHLAFWDRCHIERLEQWVSQGKEPLSIDSEVVNPAALAQWLALPGPQAARQALEAARALDARIASLPSSIVSRILATPERRYLADRTGHRREHLDQIELTLRNCGC